MESSSWPEIKPWTFGVGALSPNYQRTNPREYQVVRTHKKETTWIKTQHHPTTSSTLCGTPHQNNKQNKNTNLVTSRQEYHLTQPSPSEEKQTITTNSTNLTLYKAHTNPWTNLRRAETKRKKEFNLIQGKNSTFLWSLEKGELKHNNLKKKRERKEKYGTNERTN